MKYNNDNDNNDILNKKNLNNFLVDNIIYSKTDVKGIITEVSSSFCDLCGFTEEELIGKPHNIVRSPNVPRKTFEDMWKTIKSGKTWVGVIENKNKNGKFYFVKSFISPFYDDNHNLIGYISYRKNIIDDYLYLNTFCSNYDNADNDDNDYYEQGIEDFNILTSGIQLKSCSDVLLKFFKQKSFNDFLKNIGCVCNNFVIPKSLDKPNDFLLKYSDDGILWIDNLYEEKMVCLLIDGNEFYFKVSLKYNFNDIKLIYFKNITEFMRNKHFIEEQLTRQTNILKKQEKMAVMGDMLHNIAHQWRQPLGVISSLTSSISFDIDNDMIEPEELRENVNLIQEQANYLTKTIDTFRNYLKENKNTNTFSLISPLKSAISLTKNTLDKNNISISFNYDVSLTYNIVGIEDQFVQVVINIINNSKDAFLENIDTDNRNIIINLSETETSYNIEIIDNAGGIPNYIIENVFEPYVSTKGKNGTGIGLNMSYDIITKSFLGSITVLNTTDENKDTNGCIFIISIPK